MRYRTFGRTGWQVSEVGYGMWGMAGWTGSDDEQSFESLDRAIELGCNFFDTAWAYGDGHSERLLGATLKRHPGKRLYIATKIPPKNRKWPAQPSYPARRRLPRRLHSRVHREEPAEHRRLHARPAAAPRLDRRVGRPTIAGSGRCARSRTKAWCAHSGISVNRWQPANVLRALDSGLIDAVQVVYNVFDQSPEDELFPYCQKHQIAIIARVPFDEGSLTGHAHARRRPGPQETFGTSTSIPRTSRPRCPASRGSATPFRPA